MIINRKTDDFVKYDHYRMCVLLPNMTVNFKHRTDMVRHWITEREIEIRDELWDWCNQNTPGWKLCFSNPMVWDGVSRYQLVMKFSSSDHAMCFRMSWY